MSYFSQHVTEILCLHLKQQRAEETVAHLFQALSAVVPQDLTAGGGSADVKKVNPTRGNLLEISRTAALEGVKSNIKVLRKKKRLGDF